MDNHCEREIHDHVAEDNFTLTMYKYVHILSMQCNKNNYFAYNLMYKNHLLKYVISSFHQC